MWQMPARCNMASLIPGRIVEMIGAGAGGVAVGGTGCGVGAAVSFFMCGVVSVVSCVFICGVVCVVSVVFIWCCVVVLAMLTEVIIRTDVTQTDFCIMKSMLSSRFPSKKNSGNAFGAIGKRIGPKDSKCIEMRHSIRF